jgi:hypothetical protein
MDIQEILIEAGVIGVADIRPDDTANIIVGGRRLCFGPSRTDGSGRATAPNGWDATEYTRDGEDEDGAIWLPADYVWAETDAEMITLAAGYAVVAGPPTRIRLEDLGQSDINLLRVAGGSKGAGLKLPSGIVIPDEDTWQCLLLEAREVYGW